MLTAAACGGGAERTAPATTADAPADPAGSAAPGADGSAPPIGGSEAPGTNSASRGPALPFSDDFSDEDSGWKGGKDGANSVGYDDGTMRFVLEEPNYNNWTMLRKVSGKPELDGLGDVRVTATITFERAVADTSGGVVCRAVRRNGTDAFYHFSVGRDGTFALGEHDEDGWRVLKRANAEQSETVTASIACEGSGPVTLTGFLDGEPVVTVDDDDSPLASGATGFNAYGGATGGSTVTFDDFGVRAE